MCEVLTPGPASPLFQMDISMPTVLTADLSSVMDPPMCQLAPKKTHIICTLGPSSRSVEDLEGLLQAGMSVARFNFSHGTHEYHAECLENLRAACANVDKTCGVLLDTKGPEIRTGMLRDGEPVELKRGNMVTLTTDYSVLGTAEMIAVSYEHMARDVMPGDNILMSDGNVMLEVLETDPGSGTVTCECLNSATLGERKNCNLPGVKVDLPTLTEKDLHDIVGFGIVNDVDFIAASFVRKASDVRAIRKVLDDAGGSSIKIISKVENHEGLCNYDEILAESDAIMVARGDLGMEIPLERIFWVQKMMIRKANLLGKPVITAMQMLDSMIAAPRPTRAEATDIANIVLDGADGLLLGLETLEGKFPLDCLETTLAIAREADAVYDYESRYRRQMQQINVKLAKATDSVPWGERDAAIVVPQAAGERVGADAFGGDKNPPAVDARDAAGARRQPPLFSERRRANSMAARLEQFELEPRVNLRKEALSAAAVQTAYQIDASLIVVFSHTGETTRLVAKYHPQCPVLSLSIPTVRGGTVKWTVEGDAEARQQLVYRGVVPALSAPLDLQRRESEASHIVKQAGASKTDVEALSKAAELGLIKPGQLAVFCQLIAGLSTVKVVEFAGMSRPKSQTFSPGETRAASPSVMNRVHARRNESSHLLGHIGTEADLVAAAARHAVAAAPESPTKERAKKPKKEKSEKAVKEKSSKSKSTRKQ